METKMKGIYKGFKFITRIFVVKEREIEIGYPTDVKHVAHIGWDSHSANAPSWMNEFKNGSDFSTTSLSNLCETSNHSTWSSQDFEQSVGGCLPASALFRNCSASDHPKVPKKHKRKKIKSTTSSPKSSSTSSKSSRALKSKATTYTGMVAEVEKHQ